MHSIQCEAPHTFDVRLVNKYLCEGRRQRSQAIWAFLAGLARNRSMLRARNLIVLTLLVTTLYQSL